MIESSNPFYRWGRSAGAVFLLTILPFTCMSFVRAQLPDERLQPKDRPNIVLIYIDDLGYSDVGCFGKTYGNHFVETPNIDRLAREGMKFTHAYAAAPLCSPSRAALLTGKSPARLGFEFVTKYPGDSLGWSDPAWHERYRDFKLIPPPYTMNLPLGEVTVAEVLRKEGYHTGIVGKWHVAAHNKRYKGWSETHGPLQQGFDWAAETFGSHPYGLDKKRKEKPVKSGEIPHDELTAQAVEFIGKDHNKPFFLFVSHYYVHTPLDNTREWLIDKYRKKARNGESEKHARYAAFIETMDHYVGQLLNALEKHGHRDNTLVVFTSDNGGHPEHAYNRPFRGSKWHLYEGGVRVPMIMRWPGKIPAATTCSVPVIQTDLLPTFHELAGAEPPLERKIDGRSISALFKSQPGDALRDRSLIWHFPYYHPEGDAYQQARAEVGKEDGYSSKTTPQSAIRAGNYKLLYFYENEKVELYDILNDPAEQTDLSTVRVWDAMLLKKRLFDHLADANARFPRVNHNFKSE